MTTTNHSDAAPAAGEPDARIAGLARRRWPEDAARDWYQERPWLCGFNFLPSTAVNFIEMWQAATFDPRTIERELGWARDIGFNTLRTNLPFVVWQSDRDGLPGRLERFLAIADGLGISTMFCLMDDCGFSGDGPLIGPQPDPIPGVHNSRAVASPGRGVVMAPDRWSDVEAYIRHVVGHFADDRRILAWDIYNEPGNRMIFAPEGERAFDRELEPFSLRLMIEAFAWCRDVGPSQPLTVAGWHVPPFGDTSLRYYEHDIDRVAFALSDVISFHAYTTRDRMEAIIPRLRSFNRPVLCTEWMARQAGSRIEDQLALFHAEHIGAWQWGLVNGRSQTHVPWPVMGMPGDEKGADDWFHDLLYDDGSPYRSGEVREIRRLTAGS